MSTLKTISDLELAGRSVLMRLDLNVPIRDGKITSDARINAALPTIRHALEAGAKVAVCSHMGRPKGERRMEFSLEPVAQRLSEILKVDVALADDCIGDGVKAMAAAQRDGDLMVLENLRFHKGETKNAAPTKTTPSSPSRWPRRLMFLLMMRLAHAIASTRQLLVPSRMFRTPPPVFCLNVRLKHLGD